LRLAFVGILVSCHAFGPRFPEVRCWPRSRDSKDLAFVPTVLDKLERGLCDALVYWGWWLTGASLATCHPDLITIDHSRADLGSIGAAIRLMMIEGKKL
jgi:hypothetical protein